MAWTKDDIPALIERRSNLVGMIQGCEAGHPPEMREHGTVVTDPEDFAVGLRVKLAEVEQRLRDLGVDLDA